MQPHINPRHIATAPRDQATETRKMVSKFAARIDHLEERLAALEAKRGPGRPRKDETS